MKKASTGDTLYKVFIYVVLITLAVLIIVLTSSILLPRRVRVDCSPITQRMASEMLDLPEPLGPTTAVMSEPKASTVLSGKDLKPWISHAFKDNERTSLSSAGPPPSCRRGNHPQPGPGLILYRYP